MIKKRSATKPKAVIGTKCATTIKAKAGRFTAVFVSRLNQDTTEADMERFVQETHQLASTCTKGSFTIVNIFLLVQRVLIQGRGGAEAS